MWDKEFPKAIMMHILCSKTTLDFQQREEINTGHEHEYSPTLNRKNETMTGVDEIDCDTNENLAQKNHIDVGEDYVLKLNDESPAIE